MVRLMCSTSSWMVWARRRLRSSSRDPGHQLRRPAGDHPQRGADLVGHARGQGQHGGGPVGLASGLVLLPAQLPQLDLPGQFHLLLLEAQGPPGQDEQEGAHGEEAGQQPPAGVLGAVRLPEGGAGHRHDPGCAASRSMAPLRARAAVRSGRPRVAAPPGPPGTSGPWWRRPRSSGGRRGLQAVQVDPGQARGVHEQPGDAGLLQGMQVPEDPGQGRGGRLQVGQQHAGRRPGHLHLGGLEVLEGRPGLPGLQDTGSPPARQPRASIMVAPSSQSRPMPGPLDGVR